MSSIRRITKIRFLKVLFGALFLLALVACFVIVQGNRRPSMQPYDKLVLPAATDAGLIRVRFAGVSTLVFDDGETAFMTDGFFSRPDMSKMFTRIAPDEKAIDAGLAHLEVKHLAAVITLHGHYDHAMDAPLVARKTGAMLIGDESTLNIGRGAGLPENAMHKVAANDTMTFGQWRLTFIPSRHVPTLLSDGSPGEIIDAPLRTPAYATAWREGVTWSLLVDHASGRSFLVHASAGFEKDALKGRKADVVFLGVGSAGKRSSEHRAMLWHETVKTVGAKRVIMIHWDDFWQSLDKPLVALPYLLDDFDASIQNFECLSADDKIELRLPPLFVPFEPSP